MHGAGLTHLLWLPQYGGLLELRPAYMDWDSFIAMGRYRGLEVRVLTHQGPQTDATEFDVPRFQATARELISVVAARKHAFLAS